MPRIVRSMKNKTMSSNEKAYHVILRTALSEQVPTRGPPEAAGVCSAQKSTSDTTLRGLAVRALWLLRVPSTFFTTQRSQTWFSSMVAASPMWLLKSKLTKSKQNLKFNSSSILLPTLQGPVATELESSG